MDACQLTAAVTAAANSICSCLSEHDAAVAAAVFTQLGDTITTVLVTKAAIKAERGDL